MFPIILFSLLYLVSPYSTDLNKLCHHFRLDYRSLVDAVKVDSQSRVAFSEIAYVLYQETRLSPGMQPPHQTTSTSYPRSSRGYDVVTAPVNRRPPSHDLQYPYVSGIPYETDESFTPDHDYTPDDNSYNPQEVNFYYYCDIQLYCLCMVVKVLSSLTLQDCFTCKCDYTRH